MMLYLEMLLKLDILCYKVRCCLIMLCYYIHPKMLYLETLLKLDPGVNVCVIVL